MEIAAIGLIGVVIGSFIALFGTLWQARVNAQENRLATRRDYLINLMQQLIEARMEFEQVLVTPSYKYDALVRSVAKATAIAQALGDDAVSKHVKLLSSTSLDQYGLSIIDYVIQQISERISKLGGI